MSRRSDLIDRGAFDRAMALLGRVAGRRVDGELPQIRPGSAEAARVHDRLVDEFQPADGWDRRALREIWDSARLAVNAGRRFTTTDPSQMVPPLGRLPCPENPGGRCEGGYQVTGFIEIVDDVTGASARVPFSISTSERPTLGDIGRIAVSAIISQAGWRDYDRTGLGFSGIPQAGNIHITSIAGRG